MGRCTTDNDDRLDGGRLESVQPRFRGYMTRERRRDKRFKNKNYSLNRVHCFSLQKNIFIVLMKLFIEKTMKRFIEKSIRHVGVNDYYNELVH